MNIPFIRFFKREKPEEGSVAVAPPPVTPVEKPASERLGKTVLPNSSRIVGIAPVENVPGQPSSTSTSSKTAPISTRKISLGGSGSIAVGPKIPLGEPTERTITLPLADLVAGIPGELLKMPVDPERRVVLKAAEVERGMGTGRPTVLLRTVYNQAPEFFAAEVPAADLREVSLPFEKVVEQFSQFQVRDDQITDQAGPQYETPFLQVTLEDNKRFEKSSSSPVAKDIPAPQGEKVGAKPPAIAAAKEQAEQPVAAPKPSGAVRFSPPPTTPVPATADQAPATAAPVPRAAPAPTAKAPIRFSPPPVAPVPATNEVPPTTEKPPVAPVQSPATAATPPVPTPARPTIPIKLSAPNPAGAPPSAPTAKPSLPLDQSSASPSTTAKLSPNGTGVPAPERVPASSGSPVPTPLPAPVPSVEPTRIPFKVGPPSNDLRPESKFPAVRTNPDAPDFSSSGPRISLPLRNILRNVAPFQLSGAVDDVPETAQIEIPFSIVQPQLALGRVAVSPVQFKAALPEEYRPLFKVDDAGTPVPLLLQDVLKNLPSESLQLRGDQEEVEVTPTFETPFSTKATEDAARMKVAAVPIAKPVATPDAVAPPPPPPIAKASVKPAATPVVSAAEMEAPKPAKAAAEPTAKPPVELPKTPIEPTAKAQIQPAKETPRPVITATEEKRAAKIAAVGGQVRRTALQNLFDTDEPLDAKTVLAHLSRLPGVSSCAIVFSDGLSLAGDIPADYEADALCAIAPSILKRIGEQMESAKFGALGGVTLFCAKTQVSLFADGNICLATLHSDGAIVAEVRDRLGRTAQELARMYAQPA